MGAVVIEFGADSELQGLEVENSLESQWPRAEREVPLTGPLSIETKDVIDAVDYFCLSPVVINLPNGGWRISLINTDFWSRSGRKEMRVGDWRRVQWALWDKRLAVTEVRYNLRYPLGTTGGEYHYVSSVHAGARDRGPKRYQYSDLTHTQYWCEMADYAYSEGWRS